MCIRDRRPVEATCHTGEAVLGAPRVASLQLCDSKYPHRKSKAQGSSLRAPMAPHTSMSGIERSRSRRKPTAAVPAPALSWQNKVCRNLSPQEAASASTARPSKIGRARSTARGQGTHARGQPKGRGGLPSTTRQGTHAGSPKTERYLAHSTARDTPSTTPVLSVRGASTTGHAR